MGEEAPLQPSEEESSQEAEVGNSEDYDEEAHLAREQEREHHPNESHPTGGK